MSEFTGDEHAQKVVEQEDQTQGSKVLAGSSSSFEDQKHGEASDDKVWLLEVASSSGDDGVIVQKVPEGEEGQAKQHQVPNRGKGTLEPLFLVGGEEKKREAQKEEQMPGAQ